MQHQNVPERVYLQSEMQDYRSLVDTLEEILGEWEEKAAEAKEQAYAGVTHSGEMHVGASSGSPVEGVGGFVQKLLSFFR